MRRRSTARCAIFDLDGTILKGNSIKDFLRYLLHVERPAHALDQWKRFLERLETMAASGVARPALNAWFYRTYLSGRPIAYLRSLADRWVSASLVSGEFFQAAVCERLWAHQERGEQLAIATGSFRELVAPIADLLCVDHVICAPLEEQGGMYTGALTASPTIGSGKAQAVAKMLKHLGIETEQCTAYGDDYTDVDMLAMVGNPVAVGPGSPALLDHAKRHGWAVLPPVETQAKSDNVGRWSLLGIDEVD